MAFDPLPLADGWHPIPGDGIEDDPNRRVGGGGGSEARRFYHWAHVRVGQINAVYRHGSDPLGWKIQREVQQHHIDYMRECEQSWKTTIYDLLEPTLAPDVDEWADEFECEP